MKYGLEECFLKRSITVTAEKLCEVACQKSGDPSTCMSSFEHPLMNGTRLRPGAPCDNFQGYCDVFQKCRAVDAEGPLARLKNLLLDQKTLTNIVQWITVGIILIILSLVGCSFYIDDIYIFFCF